MKFLLSKLLSPKAAMAMAATQLGVSTASLEIFAGLVQRAVAPTAGPTFELVPAALAAASGDYSPLRMLYDNALANPNVRPVVAPLVANWLQENDKEFIALKMLALVNKLPLIHMGQDVNNVEAFLEQGLFPLLDVVFAPALECQCGSSFTSITDELLYCESCETYKDV